MWDIEIYLVNDLTFALNIDVNSNRDCTVGTSYYNHHLLIYSTLCQTKQNVLSVPVPSAFVRACAWLRA